MEKVNFNFINDNGQKKNGFVWVDEGTYKMLPMLEEEVRINYLRDIYYEQMKEQKYKRRISSLEEICTPKENLAGEDNTFEFPDKLSIEQTVINEKILMEVANNFNEEEKELIRNVLIKKVSATEFARRKGQTQQNVSKKINKIREKLRNLNIF